MRKQTLKRKRLLKKLLQIKQDKPDTKVFFFDEGRFGLQPVVDKLWVRKNIRPTTTVKTGYENFYVYSAVCPSSGEDISLFLPRVNTVMMNIFLENMGEFLKGDTCLLVMDQAGWHKAHDLIIPKNIEIVYLPPYSPELNPVERLWQWLKRHSLRNHFHPTLTRAMDAVQKCFQEMTPNFMMSLCRCNYLLHQK